jgi:hypothetical protein
MTQWDFMFYTTFSMKACALAALFFLVIPALCAVEHPYQSATVVDVQQKMNTRVLYYQVNTPITQDDSYYEISVQVGDTDWVGQYTPRYRSDTLPQDLMVDSLVQVRLEKRHMFLKRPNGGELDLVLMKHAPAKSAVGEKQAAPAKN